MHALYHNNRVIRTVMTTVFVMEQLLTVAAVVRVFVSDQTAGDEYTTGNDSQISASTGMLPSRDTKTDATSAPSCATYFVTDEILISW